ncbi:MAG: hypothetical protein KDB68_06200 [Planctomycetes bacterium]|nr:hypothetical protein [Planctomycetota bacterium]MCA8935780.1 hypothetical protein [Planctomycetota bacterium]
MRKLLAMLPAIALFGLVGTAALSSTGCDGKFAGPPGGSVTGTPGTDPLFGVTPFTFAAENPAITGFYDDVWYIDPGRDSDDALKQQLPVYADSIQAMRIAGFKGYLVNSPLATYVEVNNQYPLMLSFMSQWFRRNSDGTRIRELDQFGSLVWSSKSLDINFVTGPVTPVYDSNGVLIAYEVLRSEYPASGANTNAVLHGWSAPPPNSPGDFPPPQIKFLTNNYSEIGMVLLTQMFAAGSPQLTQALGITIGDQADNPNVENLGAIPRQAIGGGFTPVPTPTGVFGDNYADAYLAAPVLKPSTPGHTEEEAVIEYSRHLGALNSNLLVQSVGLSSGEVGTLTDPSQVVWQNGFGYSFVQNDLNNLSSMHLPGKKRDPNAP